MADDPFTVHHDAALAGRPEGAGRPARRGPDVLALLVGVVAIAVAVLAMTTPTTLVAVDPRWVLAGLAVLVGGGALLATVRRRR